jgi:chromosomal replication initiator protein
MNSAVLDQVFSVPYRHLYSTDFSGELTSMAGTPNGINRFVGDRSNFMLRFFADNQSDTSNEPSRDAECPWPLVLFGPTGTGKTALAMAILAKFCRKLDGDTKRATIQFSNGPRTADPKSSDRKPIFLSAQDFDRRYRQSLETNSLEDFRQRIVLSAGLAIDNLHQLVEKPAVQRELVTLVDLLVSAGVPFIATMNQSPLETENFNSSLSSRLSAGLCLPVHPPGSLARQEIVRELAVANRLELADCAVDLIVNQLTVTVPNLEHFFAQLVTALKTSGKTIPSADLVSVDAAMLSRLLQKDDSEFDQMTKLILKAVAAEFHLKVSDLKSNSRKQSIVQARGVAIYLIREQLGCSFKLIGSYVGNRDHSTVLHAYRKIVSMCDESNVVAGLDQLSTRSSVNRLKQKLSEKFAGNTI